MVTLNPHWNLFLRWLRKEHSTNDSGRGSSFFSRFAPTTQLLSIEPGGREGEGSEVRGQRWGVREGGIRKKRCCKNWRKMNCWAAGWWRITTTMWIKSVLTYWTSNQTKSKNAVHHLLLLNFSLKTKSLREKFKVTEWVLFKETELGRPEKLFVVFFWPGSNRRCFPTGAVCFGRYEVCQHKL